MKIVKMDLACLAALACAALPTASFAALQASGGSATFDASGPAGFHIQGKTSDVTVAESGGNVTVNVGLANLDTGIDVRNRHMRDKYLEVQKFPAATLVVARSALKVPADGQASDGSASGTMTIHGQSHPVSFTYKAKQDHGSFDVSGSVHIDMKEYGINVPSYLGITVKPGIDIAVHYVAHDV